MKHYYDGLADEQLLDLYTNTFGASKFGLHDDSRTSEIELFKEEIIKRMNQIPVQSDDLTELLTNEQVILFGKRQDDVFKLLQENILVYPYKENKNAKIIVAMDVSGSMGSWEKYIGRSIMLWIEKLLDTKYVNIDKRFVGYHTRADYLSEDELYSLGGSGGTIISTGLAATNDLINSYDYEKEDTYVFLIGDGDNLTSDNEKSIRIMKDITRKATKLYYFETNQYSRSSTFATGIKQNNFAVDNYRSYILRTKEDVHSVIKSLFKRQ